eukprot:4880954-Amphidinium_carterae.1
MQKVAQSDTESWRSTRWGSAARDPRIASLKTDAQGRRYVSESEVMNLWRPPPKSVREKVSPLLGPPVIPEFFESLRAAGLSLSQYDMQWKSRSGVTERS